MRFGVGAREEQNPVGDCDAIWIGEVMGWGWCVSKRMDGGRARAERIPRLLVVEVS